MSEFLRDAAQALLDDVRERHDMAPAEAFKCPLMNNIEEALKSSDWISVDDKRKPEKLVLEDGTITTFSIPVLGSDGFFHRVVDYSYELDRWTYDGMTHWMPLPELSEESND
jgi:hypothetical protein